MGSNEPISSKQFLSKIEESQAKLYYDIGKRVHSYFEDTFKEMQQYLQQLPPQDDAATIEEAGSNAQLLHNNELLQEEVQKLKHVNENQKSQIQKLKEEKAQLLRNATKPSSRKMKDKNDSDNLSSPDETESKTRKTRTPKNMKTIKTLTVKDGTHENEIEPLDYEFLDTFEEEADKVNEENLESREP
ncbi:hypothetical protein [Paenibacillus wynnii]|uniref:Uncharacterized protein n=1 Tax=Paenibacillus wynnii TaxID=268407 RepID=A0A098M7M4_9BACL|nr:hypothetical protein [Paenibacillus wynnii]KGE18540.1 hypothetical protein PWYN_03535 [Paenibacillus wynnii]